MPMGLLCKKEDDVDLTKVIQMVKSSLGGCACGSIVTFTGIVRSKSAEGEPVKHLEYEVFHEAAHAALIDMANALCAMEGVQEVALCHKYGKFLPGEEVLYVVIATERSATAFDTLRLAVTRIKQEIPIWKKEYTDKGEYWRGAD